MAKITGGIFGNISGKIGGLVFSTRNNQTEVRNLPKKYEGPVTDAALGARARLKLLVGFLRLFTFFIRIGYPKKPKQRMTAFNFAFSENYRCIIDGGYPNMEIDYSKVTFSKGNLDGLSRLKIDRIDLQLFDLKWGLNLNYNGYSANAGCDRIYCILYDAVDEQVVEVAAGAMRDDNHFLFFLPEDMIGKKIHVYVFLRSSTKKVVSRTQYQCLDLREPDPNEKDRNFITYCNTISYGGIQAKKERLRQVAKDLVISKAVIPKKKSGKKVPSVRDYTRNVLSKGMGSIRKSIRQKKP